MPKPNPDPKVRECLERLEQMGVTSQEVATKLSVSLQTVLRWKRESVVISRGAKQRLFDLLPGEFCEINEEELSRREIHEEDVEFLRRMLKEIKPITVGLAFHLLKHRRIEVPEEG